MPIRITVPETITVHLGPPGSNARNVTVNFRDYIKNVASSEIYPTWPRSAIIANIYAQITYALNRIYTEWYPSRGYDFDITNSTQYDQAYIDERQVFENISQIVDEIFNNFVRREGELLPYFTQFCNGTTTTCEGLSQWGSVELAEQGYTPEEILRYYYGDDIEVVYDAPVQNVPVSYPGTPLRLGSWGNDVRRIQLQLNRIARNWPSIPRIEVVDGVFGVPTENAVRAFQSIFNLTPDGIVGKATWYKIAQIYAGVRRLGELDSEGILISELQQQFSNILKLGDTGPSVLAVQYYLAMIADFDPAVPPLQIDGIFDEETRRSVEGFQREYGLPVDGIIGEQTWNLIYNSYLAIVNALPNGVDGGVRLYPGQTIRLGSSGEDVRIMQEYLSRISDSYTIIPKVAVTGYFGPETQEAVLAFQNEFGIVPSGLIGPITWYGIARLYQTLV